MLCVPHAGGVGAEMCGPLVNVSTVHQFRVVDGQGVNAAFPQILTETVLPEDQGFIKK